MFSFHIFQSIDPCYSFVISFFCFYLFLAAGQERFRAITTSYYRGADGVIMVYDVTNPDSLSSLAHTWMNEIRSYATRKPQVILVGNKTDLRCKMKQCDIDRVSELLEDVKEQLRGEGVVDVVEVSSKTGNQVNEAFEHLVDFMLVNVDRNVQHGKHGAKNVQVPVGVDIFARSGAEMKSSGLCCSLL